MKTSIEIQDLTKRYGTLVALDHVSLSVSEGSMFGLIGPDGAGKTTLYQILTTLLSPDEGSAIVTGLDVVKDYKKLRTVIGYMPEKFSLYPDLTVDENLHFFASLFGVDVEDNFDLIAPIFDQLKKFPNRMAGALSGGMKQKLAIISAWLHQPRLILMDEPFVGLDPKAAHLLKGMMRELCDAGGAIFFSTHVLEVAEKLCDKVAIIKGGKLIRSGTMEEVKGDDSLEEVFLELEGESC